MGILRENGDKQLRGFHNAAPARLPCFTVWWRQTAALRQDLQDLKGALRVFCRVRPDPAVHINWVQKFRMSYEALEWARDQEE